MKCEWFSVRNIFPIWFREQVDKLQVEDLEEIRLRVGLFPELHFLNRRSKIMRLVKSEDLSFCLNVASRYSPWSATTITKGYITLQGGHRIGICGSVINKDGFIVGMDNITSICVRISRDVSGIADQLARINGSVLIIGQPGAGKTTLLRDLVRQRAKYNGENICVVDEREELFPKSGGCFCFQPGYGVDVLCGCTKINGIEMVLRSMGPDVIAVDEISTIEDCNALLRSGWCGVKILASAHALDKSDLESRPVYRPIVETGLFDTLVVLNKQKKWHVERMV